MEFKQNNFSTQSKGRFLDRFYVIAAHASRFPPWPRERAANKPKAVT
jgi:hypothetical protein